MLDNAEQIINLRTKFFDAYDHEEYGNAIKLGNEMLNIYKKNNGIKTIEYVRDLNNLAIVYDDMRRYNHAKKLYLEALRIQKEIAGGNSVDFADILNNLADLYFNISQYKKSISAYKKILHIRKYRKKDEEYIFALYNLAAAYSAAGDFKNAILFYKESLDEKENTNLFNGYDLAEHYNELGEAYEDYRDYENAICCYQKAAALSESCANKSVYMNCLYNLAEIQGLYGNHLEAADIYEEIIAMKEKAFGKVNIDYITNKSTLANIYAGGGDYARAVDHRLELIDMIGKTMPENKICYVEVLTSLAFDYAKMGDIGKGEEAIFSALEVHKSIFSEDIVHSAMLFDLAEFYMEAGQYAKAVHYYYRSLKIKEAFFGKESIVYFENLSAIAEAFLQENMLYKALKIQKNVVENCQGTRDYTDIDYANNVLLLAKIMRQTGENKKSLILAQKATEIKKKALKDDLLGRSDAISELAFFYKELGDFENALHHFSEALTIRETEISNQSFDYALTLINIGSVYEEMGKYESAIQYYGQAVEIRRTHLGQYNTLYADSLIHLGTCFGKMFQFREAGHVYNIALRIKNQVYGEESVQAAEILTKIAMNYGDEKNYEQAVCFYSKAVLIMEKMFADGEYVYHQYNLAAFYMHNENYEQAEPLLQKVLAFCKKAPPIKDTVYSKTVKTLAQMYHNRGDNEKAISLHKEEIEFMKQGKKAGLLLQMAKLFLEDNKTEDGEAYAEEVLGLEDCLLASADIETLNVFGEIHYKNRNYEKALKIFAYGATAAERLDNKTCFGKCLYNVGKTYSKIGHMKKAENLLKQAETLQKEFLTIQHPDYFLTCMKLLEVYVHNKNAEGVDDISDKLLVFEQIDQQRLRYVYINKAKAAARDKNKSYACLQEALFIQKSGTESNESYAVQMMVLGSEFYNIKKYDEALCAFRLALSFLNNEHVIYKKVVHSMKYCYMKKKQFIRCFKLFFLK